MIQNREWNLSIETVIFLERLKREKEIRNKVHIEWLNKINNSKLKLEKYNE